MEYCIKSHFSLSGTSALRLSMIAQKCKWREVKLERKTQNYQEKIVQQPGHCVYALSPLGSKLINRELGLEASCE